LDTIGQVKLYAIGHQWFTQAAGDKLGIALAKTNLANALRVQGETDRAAALYEQALTTLKEIGDRSTSAAVARSLAKTMIVKYDFRGGTTHLARSFGHE
jgi:hypothetical protein